MEQQTTEAPFMDPVRGKPAHELAADFSIEENRSSNGVEGESLVLSATAGYLWITRTLNTLELKQVPVHA